MWQGRQALLHHEAAGPEAYLSCLTSSELDKADLSCLTSSELDSTDLFLYAQSWELLRQWPLWSRVCIWALPFGILEVSDPEEGPELARVPCGGEVLEVWCFYAHFRFASLLPSPGEGAVRILWPRSNSSLVSGIQAQDQSLFYHLLPKYSKSQCRTLVRAWVGAPRELKAGGLSWASFSHPHGTSSSGRV